MTIVESMARGALASILALASAGGQTHAPKPVPTPDSLAGITSRGVALAQYDFAAWHASDAVMALHPSTDEITGYIARRVDSTWTVAFGRLSGGAKDSFLVAYEARQVAERPDSFVVSKHATADTGYYARAARALDLGVLDFGKADRPYNAAVIPAPDDEWFVYLVPAQTRADRFPLGGDVRYRVSADGRTIRVKRQLHKTIIEYGPSSPPKAGAKMVAGTHTAVLDDYPEDTDVFHVLVRTPSVPEYIVTDAFVFTIATNGAIRYMGRREDVLRK